MKASWAATKVIESVGLRMEDVDDYIIALAEEMLERYYYIQIAAEQLMIRLGR